MKRRLLCLSLAVIIAFSVAGCGEVEDGSSAVESVASESVTNNSEVAESPDETEMTSDEVMEKFGYNGTFDDDVFERIVSEVTIGDTTFSLPCRVSELGEDFELGGAGLIYKDTLSFACDIDDDNIKSLDLWLKSYELDEAISKNINASYSFGGITPEESADTIVKYFGEPTNYFDGGEENDERFVLTYRSNNHSLHFLFDKNKKIESIEIFL